MLTVSWVGTICTNPAMCYISVRPERHSYEIIKRPGEFVLNLTNEDIAFPTPIGGKCHIFIGKIQHK